MLKKYFNWPLLILILAIIFGLIILFHPLGQKWWNLLSSAWAPAVVWSDITDVYADPEQKVKVLLVPGHDNQYSGAVFGDLKEADAVLAIAEPLFDFFNQDENFEVEIIRDLTTGEYQEDFEYFLKNKREDVMSFRQKGHILTQSLFNRGKISFEPLGSNSKTSEIAYRLYATNYWAMEKNFDLVLHIHINDQARNNLRIPGTFRGFSIFIPAADYHHHKISRQLAKSLFAGLQQFLMVSIAPGEKRGIIESDDLIATGAIGSINIPSVLLEYGYIYESVFRKPEVRELAGREMAWYTYLSTKASLAGEDPVKSLALSPTALADYSIGRDLKYGLRDDQAVYLLQRRLQIRGFYPPAGRSLAECPVNGNFGPCTQAAVIAFQERHRSFVLEPFGLTQGTGVVGERTRRVLAN
ncbi:MAG: N-acetylmuramoyl-L-alanine amidase [Patescibacteria group bacterium]